MQTRWKRTTQWKAMWAEATVRGSSPFYTDASYYVMLGKFVAFFVCVCSLSVAMTSPECYAYGAAWVFLLIPESLSSERSNFGRKD